MAPTEIQVDFRKIQPRNGFALTDVIEILVALGLLYRHINVS